MLTQDSTDPTGVSDDSPRGGSNVARARDRKAAAALELKRSGASWDDICEVLGYPTPRAALVATEQALEKQLATPETRDYMRTIASGRLDRLLQGVWKKAIDDDPKNTEHLAAVREARGLIADYRKLHGLDAPAEYVVHSPTLAEIEQWVSRMSAGEVTVEEDDIFEADVVEEA